MFKHFIWDFDGTLYDTYPVSVVALRHALNDYGVDDTPDHILSLMKITLTYAVDYYLKNYSVGKDLDERFTYYRLKDEVSVKPYPYIKELCEKICSLEAHNYLYTHRDKTSTDYLKRDGLLEYFTDFITKEDGFEFKPSPQALNSLISKRGIPKEKAIMIGDRDIDILSGKNAGIATCFYDGCKYGKVDFADYTVKSFKEMVPLIDKD